MEEEKEIGKVESRVEDLRKIKEEKDAGKLFCIPFQNYPKLAQSVPGIVPGMITMITAGSGVGKTQVAKALAVREPLEYAVKNNMKCQIGTEQLLLKQISVLGGNGAVCRQCHLYFHVVLLH